VPDDLLLFDLVFQDPLLQDVGDEVEVSIIFGFRHEDVAAAWRGYVARRCLWVVDEPYRRLAQVLDEYVDRDQRTFGPQLGEDVARDIVVTENVVELQALKVT
jgi:hypothetical protein